MPQRRESSARSRYLGAELRAHREAAHLSGQSVSHRLGWAASTVTNRGHMAESEEYLQEFYPWL